MLLQLNAVDRRWLAVWFLVALLIRGATIGALAGMLEKDNDGYRQLAENLRQDGVYGFYDGPELKPTAFRPPLYPLLLSTLVREGRVYLPWVAVLHAALGAATVLCVWIIARELGLGFGAHVAAGITALDPLLLIHSPQLMTETLAAFFAAAALLLLAFAAQRNTKTAWALSGVVLGLAGLCRPTFLLTTALVLALMLLWSRRRHWLAMTAIVGLSAAAPVLVWTARNWRALGQPILATTHGGYTMLLGNNKDYYQHLRDGGDDVWRADELDRHWNEAKRQNDWNEIQYDRATSREARSTIVDDPAGFLIAASHRLFRLASVLPNRTDPVESSRRKLARWLVAVWYAVVLGLAGWAGFCAALRRERETSGAAPSGRETATWVGLCLLAFLASFAALHTIYWCDMRMRAPLSPLLAIAAAVGLERLTASRLAARTLAEQSAPATDD